MIKKWHVKAAVQTVVAALPASTRINYLLQHVTGGNKLDDRTFLYKVTHAAHHVENFKSRRAVPGSKALELGTGWFPVIPMFLYLSGFDEVWSVDVHDWLLPENVVQTVRKYQAWDANGKLAPFKEHILPERWASLSELATRQGRDLDALCTHFRFHPVQADARRLTLFADGTFDLICSNNTFEHIPPDVLRDILREFRRVVKRGGLMSHHIDMTDHHSHFDGSISRYNFLYVDDRLWRFVNNDLNYQNRLRFVDFKRMYDALGLGYEEKHVIPGKPELIDRAALVPPFDRLDPEELAVIGGYLVSYEPSTAEA